jgi:modification methylase
MTTNSTLKAADKESILRQYVSPRILGIGDDQKAIPALAKDQRLLREIEEILPNLPTVHDFHRGDATKVQFLKPESVHLVVTSPPYWTLKKYNERERQLGAVEDYNAFLGELKKVWKKCFRALVPGGRLVCVVGDVCLSRRKNNGRHTVVPLHASIQDQCRKLGFDNLAPIIWYKISNAAFEASGKSSFLGKPYEPNSVIKNDVEFILMQRKPGGYRSPKPLERKLSVISEKNHKTWFNQIWEGLTGASTRDHPAPYPLELACRLVRMFSFVGDTVLDPFLGTGTTSIAARLAGRNSIGIEVDDEYLKMAVRRFQKETAHLAGNHVMHVFD